MIRVPPSLSFWPRWLLGSGAMLCLSACPAPGAALESGRCRCVQDCPAPQQCLIPTDSTRETLTSECLPMAERAGFCEIPPQP